MNVRSAVKALVPVGLLGLLVWYAAPKESPMEKLHELKERASRGTDDDPIARDRWEFERLKDPNTGRIPPGIRAKEIAFASTLPTRESRRGLAKGEQAQALTWTKRGPVNVGGRTRALAVDKTNASVLLGGGVSGGMWRSTDNGASWSKTTGSPDIQSVTCIAQDTRSSKEATWYYGTGEATGNSTSAGGAYFNGAGIFKSTNGGSSWSAITSTVGSSPVGSIDSYFDFVWRIAIDPSNGVQDEVYAATILGIQRSTNGGTNWTTVRGAFANAGPYYTDVQVSPTGVVYAAISTAALDGTNNGTNAGIWRSTDGTTWTQINSGVSGFPATYGRVVVGIAPSNENAVYFLMQGTSGSNGADQINDHQIWKYTFVSGDGSGAGGTWVNKGVSLPNEAGVSDNAVFSTQGGYDMTVYVKPDNENYVIVGGVNLYRTADFSVSTPTWTRIGGYAGPSDYSSYTNHHSDQHSGAFSPGSNIIFYTGNDGGIEKTTDVTASTVSWTRLNNGYVTSQFYTIALDHATSADNVLIGGLQDNGTWWTNTTNASTAWLSQFGGDGGYCAVADGKTSYYFSSQNGNMYRFVLNASGAQTNWANVQPTGGSGYQFINPFVLDPNNTNMMYLAGGDRVWRNSDLTAITTQADNTTTVNWTEFTNAVMPNSAGGEVVTSLGVSKGGTANRLYIGSNAASVYRIDNANSGNPTLTDVSGINFPASGNVGCVAVNPSNADEVLGVFTNYGIPSLFYTTNGGTSWTDVSGNLEQNSNGSGNGPSCRWAAIVQTTQTKTFFVATSTGLYSASTVGSGTVWAQEGASTIGNVVCDMIDFRPADGLVAAATHGNGVFSANITIVSAPEDQPTVPTEFALHQNYPNPFNPSTTIRYTVPGRAHIRITIHDIAGREVAVLVDLDQQAGDHEVRWDGRDSRRTAVSSGTYFYTMTASGGASNAEFSKTEKMALVK